MRWHYLMHHHDWIERGYDINSLIIHAFLPVFLVKCQVDDGII